MNNEVLDIYANKQKAHHLSLQRQMQAINMLQQIDREGQQCQNNLNCSQCFNNEEKQSQLVTSKQYPSNTQVLTPNKLKFGIQCPNTLEKFQICKNIGQISFTPKMMHEFNYVHPSCKRNFSVSKQSTFNSYQQNIQQQQQGYQNTQQVYKIDSKYTLSFNEDLKMQQFDVSNLIVKIHDILVYISNKHKQQDYLQYMQFIDQYTINITTNTLYLLKQFFSINSLNDYSLVYIKYSCLLISFQQLFNFNNDYSKNYLDQIVILLRQELQYQNELQKEQFDQTEFNIDYNIQKYLIETKCIVYNHCSLGINQQIEVIQLIQQVILDILSFTTNNKQITLEYNTQQIFQENNIILNNNTKSQCKSPIIEQICKTFETPQGSNTYNSVAIDFCSIQQDIQNLQTLNIYENLNKFIKQQAPNTVQQNNIITYIIQSIIDMFYSDYTILPNSIDNLKQVVAFLILLYLLQNYKFSEKHQLLKSQMVIQIVNLINQQNNFPIIQQYLQFQNIQQDILYNMENQQEKIIKQNLNDSISHLTQKQQISSNLLTQSQQQQNIQLKQRNNKDQQNQICKKQIIMSKQPGTYINSLLVFSQQQEYFKDQQMIDEHKNKIVELQTETLQQKDNMQQVKQQIAQINKEIDEIYIKWSDIDGNFFKSL